MSNGPAWVPPWFIQSPLTGKPPGTDETTPEFFYEQPFRKGDYGRHSTNVGKIVYQRRKKTFTEKDFARISAKIIFHVSEDPPPDKSWWIKLIERLTIKMMEKIWAVLPFSFFVDVNIEDLYWNIRKIGDSAMQNVINGMREKGLYEAADALQKLDDLGQGK